MNEDMKRQEAELNEQTLEGVSGGESGPGTGFLATITCGRCDRRGACSQYVTGLICYMKEHGVSITSCGRCPFYGKAE